MRISDWSSDVCSSDLVDQDVEASEPLDGLVDHGNNLSFVSDVGPDEFRLRAPFVPQPLGGFEARCLVDLGNQHRRAFTRERARHSAPDAHTGTGDHCYTSVELAHWALLRQNP